MDAGTVTLRELCDLLEVSRRAVQGYEKAGLVSATGKNKYGYLLYDEEAQKRIAMIKLYQQFGFKVKEIREIIDAPEAVVKVAIREKILDLEKERDKIDELLKRAFELVDAV